MTMISLTNVENLSYEGGRAGDITNVLATRIIGKIINEILEEPLKSQLTERLEQYYWYICFTASYHT